MEPTALTPALKLVDIRCPRRRTAKVDGKVYLCGHLCVKVAPGSAGEAYCWLCHEKFDFEVDRSSSAS